MQLMKDITDATKRNHYGQVLAPSVTDYEIAYSVIQKEMANFIAVLKSLVLPAINGLTEELCAQQSVSMDDGLASALNELGSLPQAYGAFEHGPPPMFVRPVLGTCSGYAVLQSTPLMDPMGTVAEIEEEFGMKNKDVAPFCSSPLVTCWQGEKLNLHGVCMLIHIVNLEATKNFAERTKGSQPDGKSLSFISTKTPLSKMYMLMTLFSFSILSYYLATAVTILGNGNRSDASHVLSVPIPCFFLTAYLGKAKSTFEYIVALNNVAYMEGVTGVVHYTPTPKEKPTSRHVPNVLPKRSPYRVNKGMIHFLLERRGARRLFALYNFLGFFQFLPRLVGIMKSLDPDNPYPDAYQTTKDVLRGVRNQCLLTAFFDTPIIVQPRSLTMLNGMLGTGSEKTVFELSVNVSDTDDKDGVPKELAVSVAVPIAARYNSGVFELKHLEVCIGDQANGLVGHYRGTHLFMPVMKTADTVIKKGVNLRLLLEFIESVLLQLQKLNKSGYIHRDFKLKNVLTMKCEREVLDMSTDVIPLSPVCTPSNTGQYYVLSDFGHTAPIGRVVTCSTKAYADPCHIYRPAHSKLDVWCLGLTLFKLCTNATQVKDVLREFYKIFNANKVELRQQKKMMEMGSLYKERLIGWSDWWQTHIWNHIEHVTAHKNYVLPIWSPPNWADDPEESHYMNYVFLADFVQAIKGCLVFDLESRWSIEMMLKWSRYWQHSLNVRTCVPPTAQHLMPELSVYDKMDPFLTNEQPKSGSDQSDADDDES